MSLDPSLKTSALETSITSMPTLTISGADCSIIKKRTSLTNAEKLTIVRWHEFNKSTQRKTAERFGVSKSALNRMLGDKDRLEAVAHSRNDSLRKKFRPCKFNDINLAMRKWFDKEKSKNPDFYADKKTLFDKAHDVATELGYPTCPVDLSWVLRFKSRCDMSKKTSKNGHVASISQERVPEFPTSSSTFCFICGQVVAENMKLVHILKDHIKMKTFTCPGCDYSSTFDFEDVRSHIAQVHPKLLIVGVVDHRAIHQKQIVEQGERCFPGSIFVQRNGRVLNSNKFEARTTVPPSAETLPPLSAKRVMIKQETCKSLSPVDFTPTDILTTLSSQQRSPPKLEPESNSSASSPPEKHLPSVPMRRSMLEIASLLQIAADLNLKFTFNADQCGEYCLEVSDGSGTMVVIADYGSEMQISERIDGDEVDVEVLLMASWEQLVEAVRKKCNRFLD